MRMTIARITVMVSPLREVSSVAAFVQEPRRRLAAADMSYTRCTVTQAKSRQTYEPVAVGVVLAGGEARRMGRDRRLLRLAGATLLERNLRFLRSIFPTVALSRARRLARCLRTCPPGSRSCPTR